MYTPDFSSEKFRGLILYAAHKAREIGDPWFGAVKLNKVLFFSDFLAYRDFGTSITGATYQKLTEGPAPRELLKEREALIKNEDLKLETARVFNYVQHRLIPTREQIDPGEIFDGWEIEVIDEVIATLSPMTAAEVSELSHHEMGWRIAGMYDDIPYESALLAPWPQETEIDGQRDA